MHFEWDWLLCQGWAVIGLNQCISPPGYSDWFWGGYLTPEEPLRCKEVNFEPSREIHFYFAEAFRIFLLSFPGGCSVKIWKWMLLQPYCCHEAVSSIGATLFGKDRKERWTDTRTLVISLTPLAQVLPEALLWMFLLHESLNYIYCFSHFSLGFLFHQTKRFSTNTQSEVCLILG